MNFSRRQATAPSPPSPAFTLMRTSSTNFTPPPNAKRRGALGPAAPACSGPGPGSGLGDHRDHAPVVAGPRVLHLPVGGGEEREVLAHADVGAGVDHRPQLADEDVAR